MLLAPGNFQDKAFIVRNVTGVKMWAGVYFIQQESIGVY